MPAIENKNLKYNRHRRLNRHSCKTILLLIVSVFYFCKATAQSKEPATAGVLKGKVKDSVYNFVLSSATVAVYKDWGMNLVQFSLPNNFGEFTVRPLPTGIPLRLVITHVGFKDLSRKFIISKEKGIFDFGQLYMYQKTEKDGSTLEEVIVKTVAPMRMNGDTLEFNADAFKLDKNATAEDLMRRLPGFTIWGDGDITFNGKKINAVLVEGKPFMGGADMTVATQNLPKEALDKIQVFQQRNDKNPLDSTLFANIKLKDDKKMGYFGKISGGYGTDKRYAADGMLSGFNKKLQISTVGAINNVNKVANGIDALIKNSSYKGEGTSIDYQPDFTMRGLNRPISGGFKFQYDFIPDVAYQKTSRLNADYFISGNKNNSINTTTTNTILGQDSLLIQKSNNNNYNNSTNQLLNTAYLRQTRLMSLTINSAFSINQNNSVNESNSQQERTGAGIISTSDTRNEDNNTTKNSKVAAEYTHHQDRDYSKRILFTAGYVFNAIDNNGSGRNISSYRSTVDASGNQDFNRFYQQKDGLSLNHTFYAGYPRLKQLIFGRAYLQGIEIKISDSVTFTRNTNNNKVFDFDTLTHQNIQNNYLTNKENANIVNMTPVLGFSKTFENQLTNRYLKYVSINLNIKGQHYSMWHDATQIIQNFKYEYNKFIPDADITYHNHQYGNYEANYSLRFNTNVNYPQVNRIAPLIDSANLWYIPIGNPGIKPEYQKTLSFSYTLTSRKPKNPYGIDLVAGLTTTNAKVVDSVLIDSIGRQHVYGINMDGYRSFNGELDYRKSFQTKNNTFQIQARYSLSLSRFPQYINNILNISNSKGNDGNVKLTYSYKDRFTMSLEQGLSYYSSAQKGFNNNSFSSNNQYTKFSGALLWPKNLTWSSNISYNRSGSNNQTAVNYTIWNASLTYRFLKDNQGEIKCSALDLLHQNKSIINTGNANSQSFGYGNVLQQYCMVTLSYYPRQFGKREKKRKD